MKKRGLVVSGAALVVYALALMPAAASAAACANTSNLGSVEMAVPDLPEADTHAIWVRLQSPTNAGKVDVEVNHANCFEISGENMIPNQWSWQTYRQNGTVKPLKFPNLKGNTISIIGIQDGVKVDRVLVTRSDCVPLEFGENCGNAAQTISALSKSLATLIAPPSNDPVSGKVVLSSTPLSYQSQLKNLSYSVDSGTLQSSDKNEPFDTTLVANGKYTVYITTTLNSGDVIREQTVIEVENLESIISPVSRWVRLHTGIIKTAAMWTGALVVTFFLFSRLRRWYLRHRDRRLHGF